MRHYDFLFVTHLPAFYKINLYQALSRSARVFVIFIGEASTIRLKDFTKGNIAFDYVILNSGPFEKRNLFVSLAKLFWQLKKIKAKHIVVGGWDLGEFWFIALTHQGKTLLNLESSIYESKYSGLSGWLKRQFLSHIQTVFACGEPHIALLKALQFKRKIKKTGGVGIFQRFNKDKVKLPFQGRFLYVGRFAPEKNLSFLIRVFNELPQFSLTLVGEGQVLKNLRQSALSHITFRGYIDNAQLPAVYQEHDVLILPSQSETWGLVVEEALYYGLPVIVSDKVGCAIDLVKNLQNGLIFETHNTFSLKAAVLQMACQFDKFVSTVSMMDFSMRDKLQLQSYLEVSDESIGCS